MTRDGDRDERDAAYLVHGEMRFDPVVLKQNLRARSHGRVLLKALRQERLQLWRRAFRERRRTAFDDPVHDCKDESPERVSTLSQKERVRWED